MTEYEVRQELKQMKVLKRMNLNLAREEYEKLCGKYSLAVRTKLTPVERVVLKTYIEQNLTHTKLNLMTDIPSRTFWRMFDVIVKKLTKEINSKKEDMAFRFVERRKEL